MNLGKKRRNFFLMKRMIIFVNYRFSEQKTRVVLINPVEIENKFLKIHLLVSFTKLLILIDVH